MSEYQEGDLVEAVSGDTKIVARLQRDPAGYKNPLAILTCALHFDVAHLEANGYTVTVLEKAAPPLPTASGYYQAEAYGVKYLFQLSEHDRGWFYIGNEYQPAPNQRQPNDAEARGLTRLEPVPVTVQKVLQRVASFWEFGAPPSVADELDNIAREFGAS